MSDDQVSEQAVPTGDAQTPEEGGQFESSASLAPEQALEIETQPEQETPQNEESKEQRHSDKDWQDMVEKTAKAEQFMEKFSEMFGDKETEEAAPDPVELFNNLSGEVNSLKSELDKARFEATNPITDNLKEAWEKVNSDEKYDKLTFDERLRLISSPDSTPLKDELIDQAKVAEGSVP